MLQYYSTFRHLNELVFPTDFVIFHTVRSSAVQAVVDLLDRVGTAGSALLIVVLSEVADVAPCWAAALTKLYAKLCFREKSNCKIAARRLQIYFAS